MSRPADRLDASAVAARLPALIDALSAFPEVGAVYLFGSFARGNPKRLSDVDIAVLTDEAGESATTSAMPEYAGASMKALGTDRLDLVLLRSAPLALRHRVFRDGKLLFVRDTGTLARFREDSLRRYLDTIPLRRIYAAAYFRRVRERGFAG